MCLCLYLFVFICLLVYSETVVCFQAIFICDYITFKSKYNINTEEKNAVFAVLMKRFSKPETRNYCEEYTRRDGGVAEDWETVYE